MRPRRTAAGGAALPPPSSARRSFPAAVPRSEEVLPREADEPLLVRPDLVDVDVREPCLLERADLLEPRLGVGPERRRLLDVLRLDDLGGGHEVRRQAQVLVERALEPRLRP